MVSSTNFANGFAGPNFQISTPAPVAGGAAVPERTTALFGLALVGACGLSRRRRTAAAKA